METKNIRENIELIPRSFYSDDLKTDGGVNSRLDFCQAFSFRFLNQRWMRLMQFLN